MTCENTCYEVDVYVDSSGRYHLPLRLQPITGRPTRYEFGGEGESIAGHGVTVWRASEEGDAVVFTRAYDALTEAGYEVKEPRGYRVFTLDTVRT